MVGGPLFDRNRVVSPRAHGPALVYSRARHGPGTGGPGTLSMVHPRTSRDTASAGTMVARAPDPSLGVPRTNARLGEPGTDRTATPRAGPNRCATGPGVASGPQVTSGQGRRARKCTPVGSGPVNERGAGRNPTDNAGMNSHFKVAGAAGGLVIAVSP